MENLQKKTKQSPLSFAAYCEQWLLYIRPKVKESTYSMYYNQISKHIIPFLGEFDRNTLTRAVINNFSIFLKEQQGLSSKTQKDVLVLLTSIFDIKKENIKKLRALGM